MTTSTETVYSVESNDTSKTHFKWKVVKTTKYDSGHGSTIDVDFFVEKYEAIKFAEKMNKGEE